MPAYSFKERFIPLIKSGEKRQTIRRIRKYPVRPGDSLYLYYGLRTKNCRLIMETTCQATEKIRIGKNGSVLIKGRPITQSDKDILAYLDGFRNQDRETQITGCFNIMMRWWRQTHELPFSGEIIHW
jgi:hypothetical protein